MTALDTTVTRLNEALLDESAWHEDLATKLAGQISNRPNDWAAIVRHWPALSSLVEEFVRGQLEDGC